MKIEKKCLITKKFTKELEFHMDELDELYSKSLDFEASFRETGPLRGQVKK